MLPHSCAHWIWNRTDRGPYAQCDKMQHFNKFCLAQLCIVYVRAWSEITQGVMFLLILTFSLHICQKSFNFGTFWPPRKLARIRIYHVTSSSLFRGNEYPNDEMSLTESDQHGLKLHIEVCLLTLLIWAIGLKGPNLQIFLANVHIFCIRWPVEVEVAGSRGSAWAHLKAIICGFQWKKSLASALLCIKSYEQFSACNLSNFGQFLLTGPDRLFHKFSQNSSNIKNLSQLNILDLE